MSKYIDLELALNELLRLYEEDCDRYGVEIPECFDYGRAKEALIDLPIIEVSEDAISREYLKSFEYINKGDFNSVETIREWIDNAPSVIPKTDCSTCKWGEWYRNGRDITNMDDECGGCCSWNSKWTPKETETEAERLDRIDNEIEDAWARIKELTPQTDCD